MTGTRGFHKKTLVEQAGEAHTGTSEGSADTGTPGADERGRYLHSFEKCKKQALCALQTHNRTHTRTHACGNQGGSSVFFGG